MYKCSFMILVSLFWEMKDVYDAAPESSMAALPWTLNPATTTSPTDGMILCNTCITTCTDLNSCKQSLNRGMPLFQSPECHSLTLQYESGDEDHIVREIFAMGRTSSNDRPPQTAAFLLCMCVQHSASCLQTSDLRRLLLLIANGVQTAMWVSGTAAMVIGLID